MNSHYAWIWCIYPRTQKSTPLVKVSLHKSNFVPLKPDSIKIEKFYFGEKTTSLFSERRKRNMAANLHKSHSTNWKTCFWKSSKFSLAQCSHMEVKVAVLNAISQSCNPKSDVFEVKIIPYPSESLCLIYTCFHYRYSFE